MGMTLEEAIVHAEKVAEENEKISLYTPVEFIPADLSNEQCQNCAAEHRQLAEWLKELAERRKQLGIVYCKDCKHYYTDVRGGELGIGGMYENIIVAHNACDRWTKGMNCVEPEGFCFLAERRTDD